MGRSKNSSGGKGLAVFAMLIAIGSLALSGYIYTLIPSSDDTNEQVITQIWYDNKESAYSLSSSFTDITDLELSITVNAGEKVFIIFSGEFTLSTGTTGGEIRLAINDAAVTGTHKGFYGDSSGLNHWGSLTLQHVAVGLSAGTHKINIQALAAGGTGTIQNMNLVVYTFK